jgi:hypothetical protein
LAEGIGVSKWLVFVGGEVAEVAGAREWWRSWRMAAEFGGEPPPKLDVILYFYCNN